MSAEFTASEMAVALIEGAGSIDGQVLGFKQTAATYYVENVATADFSRESAAEAVTSVNGPISLRASYTATDYVVSGTGESYTLIATATPTVSMRTISKPAASIEVLLERIYPKYKVMCEPQMSKRGLYPTLSTKKEKRLTKSFMDFLQYADGTNSLEKISVLIDLNFKSVKKINSILFRNNLIVL